MTSAIAKFAFGKVLKETAQNHFGRDEDPYYEVPAQNLGRISRKWRRRKRKALPPGITEEEGLVLTTVKRRAYRLDMALGSFLGMKVGWSSLIGIIPVIGDVVDAMFALLVVKTACKLPLPSGLIIHMLINVIFDFVIGLIPFIGDLADIGYKCNTRNAVLLESHLRKKGAAHLKSQGVTHAEDPSLPEYDSGPEDEESQVAMADMPAGRTGGVTQPAATYSGAGRSGSRREQQGDRSAVKHSKSKSKSRKERRDGPPREPGSTYR